MPKPNLTQLDAISSQLPASDQGSNDPSSQLDHLTAELADQQFTADLESTVLRLSDFLAAVEMTIQHTFDHSVWVKAEIRNMSSKNGHYYFELAEKDDSGKVVASCRGNLWRFKATRVLTKFERATGMLLARDLTVLLKITPKFHPQYGFSLIIEDIDPSFTLGDLAQQYAAIIDKLAGEGLLRLNARLPSPFDIEHVLVIAPEKAAGLGDFRADADRLARSKACQFHYHHATFQGNHAPGEIRSAITSAMTAFQSQFEHLPDLIVIIRGGGAVGDLAYLNDYELAALVAEQPVPVWVGIGHERDTVILDEVAHTSFDTPSKVIAAIFSHLTTLVSSASEYSRQIHTLARQQISQASQQSSRQLSRIQALTASRLTAIKKDSDHSFVTIKHAAHHHLRQANQQTALLIHQHQLSCSQQVTQARQLTNANQNKVAQLTKLRLVQSRQHCDHLRDLILLQHPARVLDRGYALIQDTATNELVSCISELNPASTLTIILKDGQAQADVTKIIPTKEN